MILKFNTHAAHKSPNELEDQYIFCFDALSQWGFAFELDSFQAPPQANCEMCHDVTEHVVLGGQKEDGALLVESHHCKTFVDDGLD